MHSPSDDFSNRGFFLVVFLATGLASCTSPGKPKAPLIQVPYASNVEVTESVRRVHEATGRHGIVSTQGKAATQAARRMFELHGNAIDAAIAASFAISVERPQSTGLGGGGFMLFREAKTGQIYAVDFRERAPLRATPRMYLDLKGAVIPKLSTDGILAVATPGLVAGLLEIHHRFGSLPLATVVQPAIELAETGFEIYPSLADGIAKRRTILARFPASRAIFLHANGQPLRVGERLIQKDLGKTLRKIAREGKRAIYEGQVRRSILAESGRLRGILGAEDFSKYVVHWREPIRGSFKELEVVSMPPPSSGGTHVLEVLNLLEPIKLRKMGFLSANAIHWESSALQHAFADRAEYMGDPDFVKVPSVELSSKPYAARLRAEIDPRRATPAGQVKPGALSGTEVQPESRETTHLSIMDDQGNVVASTQTINGRFGSGVVAPGTGIVLNNEMDDFSATPGSPNLFGAVGGSANAIAPLKTPLSSMSPTILLRGGQPVMAVGAPGGTRIISCVAETILNYFEFGLSLYDSIAAVRFHQQWRPDEISMDSPGPGAATVADLQGRGHHIVLDDDSVYCRVMAVAREGTGFIGVSDPRDAGTVSGW